MNGEPAKADETYIAIYSQAEKSICIVDNYINIKTLRLLQGIRNGVSVTIFSDNSGNHLHASDYNDFQTEFPEISVKFLTTGGVTHDRFILLDYGTPNERIFHCGASSKDAGNKLTSITEYTEDAIKTALRGLVEKMMGNPPLTLR